MNNKKIIISVIIVAVTIIIINLTYYCINNTKNNIKETANLQQSNKNIIETEETVVANSDKKNIVLNLSSYLDYAIDLTDNNARAENADYIVLATVKTIDGTTNYNEKAKEYTAIFTYGNMEITKVLQGNIELGEVPYIRLGGDIAFSEYEKSLKESQKTKMELISTLSEEEKKTSYVSYSPNGDISLEIGKTYLMYLKYNSDYDRYMCSFMQYGTREVNTATYNNQTRTISTNNDILVKNNESGGWETLSSVLD